MPFTAANTLTALFYFIFPPFRQFEAFRSSLHHPIAPPVTLLITVSSHKSFSFLQMKTSQRGPSLYLARRMCNYAAPLGTQSQSGAQDVTSFPSVCLWWFDPSSSFCLCTCLFAVRRQAENATFIWKQSELAPTWPSFSEVTHCTCRTTCRNNYASERG